MKSVLITGASSGLGRALAVELAKENYYVFAGVRSKEDQQKITKLHVNIHPIILDITENDQIEKAFETISEKCEDTGLSVLINNAGINYISSFEYGDLYKDYKVLDVNFLGVIKLTRKMMPLLHKNVKSGKNGEISNIVNVGSIGSVFALPWSAAYSASKFALLGWSESLRMELKQLNIFVSCFLPGGMSTSIFQKSIEQVREDSSINNSNGYYKRNIEHALNTTKRFEKGAAPPEVAAQQIVKLLKSKTPPLKVFFGRATKFIRFFNWLGLSSVLQKQFVIR